MNNRRWLLKLPFVALLAGNALALQAPAAPMAAEPAFEVATVKPSAPDPAPRRFTIQGRRFLTYRTTLADLINFAYGLHPRQIANAPEWLESERYDIVGTPEGEGQPSEPEWMAMIARLLTDRFHLRFHREKRELPVYALTPANSGLKLMRSDGDPAGLPAFGFIGLGRLVARNACLADLAWELQSMVLDRPVVDQSGLSGRFDFTLNWTPDEFQLKGRDAQPPPPGVDVPPDIFTAMQQQLGLRIEARRAPADVLVIDAVERPSGD